MHLRTLLNRINLLSLPHPLWPLPLISNYPTHRPLRISVLDASFNPPTLAHLALINAQRPSDNNGVDDEDYDARLLLLSVRNADKSLKPGDATHDQRLQMMNLLATNDVTSPNVAVAIIDEPTFVAKSSRLLQFLKERIQSQSEPHTITPSIQLSFLMGLDTLERLVAPRYYPSEESMLSSLRTFLSPEADNSLIVCAHRISQNPSTDTTTKSTIVEEFIQQKRIIMIDIGEEESTYSSTAVRTAIKELGYGLEEESRNVWSRYVPKSVADYIVKERLYTDTEERDVSH